VKIAYLINTYPQASQSFIRREIAALEAMGLHIERFTVRRWNTPLVDPGDRAERQRTRCLLEAGALRIALATLGVLCRRPRRWWTTLGMALRLGWRSDRGMAYQLIYFAEACLLLGWLEASGIEHVHAHFGTNAPMLALLCRHLGGPPYSFTVHGPEEFERPRALKLAQKIASAQSVAAVSEFGRSQLYLWCAAEDWDKIHVIHCGVDRSFLDAQSPPCTAARLVCVGRLAKQKGQLLLVRAAGLLAQRHVDFELRLIGDGPLRPEIEALIARLGLQQQVRLCGWLSNEQVLQEITAARALVLPSFAEGLPVVLMEALALRRPVISTYLAGIPELVESGVSGYLSPRGNLQLLAQAMQQMLEADGAELQRMGEAGAARVAQQHDAAREARRLAELWGAKVGDKEAMVVS